MHTHYLKRREKLLSYIEKDSVIILATNPEQKRSNDTLYPFRPNSNFYYLTGFTQPHSVLVLSHKEYSLFVQPKNKHKELWDGEVLGLDGVSEIWECQTYDINNIQQQLVSILNNYTKVYFDSDNIHSLLSNVLKPSASQCLNPLITKLRLIKDDVELSNIRHACAISSDAHIRAMKSVTQCQYEYEVKSIFDYYFSLNNTEHAYIPIVAGGNNANTLHYIKNNSTINTSDLLLIDAGCEYQYYASDITRTFPISGIFTKAQSVLYDIVLDTQIYTINQVKKGITINQLDRLSKDFMTTKLKEIGIMEQHTISDFFPHSIGHFLGLDVHDVGNRDIVLEPNMVLTVEPGVYIPFSAKIAKEFDHYKGIGIRIEDDVLVTDSNTPQVLTNNCPKNREAIEHLMQNNT